MKYLALLMLLALPASGQSIGGGGAAGGSGAEVTYHRSQTCEVDPTFGNDLSARCGGPPFRTIPSAVAAATAGSLILVWPGVYNLTTHLTLPANTVFRCVSVGSCILQRTGVTADADLLVLNSGSVVDGWFLFLTSTMHVNLRGIVFNDPSPATRDGNVRNTFIQVDNSTAGDAGTSNVYGVVSASTTKPQRALPQLRSDTMLVLSAGQGEKRGLKITTNHNFHLRDVNVDVRRTGAGTGSYVGVETTHASAFVSVDSGNISGTTDDVRQTAGQILLGSTVLVNFTASGLGFQNAVATAVYVWCDPGLIGQGTKFLSLGCATSTGTEVQLRMPRQGLAKSIFVHAGAGPGVGKTVTFTVRKNGVDTGLLVSLTGTQTEATFDAVSVHYDAADLLSVKTVAETGDSTQAVHLGVEVY